MNLCIDCDTELAPMMNQLRWWCPQCKVSLDNRCADCGAELVPLDTVANYWDDPWYCPQCADDDQDDA